jgi:hypothetical protein
MADLLEINRLFSNRPASASDGAIGSMGAGEENGKGSSLPLISSILPIFKDSKRGWLTHVGHSTDLHRKGMEKRLPERARGLMKHGRGRTARWGGGRPNLKWETMPDKYFERWRLVYALAARTPGNIVTAVTGSSVGPIEQLVSRLQSERASTRDTRIGRYLADVRAIGAACHLWPLESYFGDLDEIEVIRHRWMLSGARTGSSSMWLGGKTNVCTKLSDQHSTGVPRFLCGVAYRNRKSLPRQ